MSWFQLDPDSVIARVQASGQTLKELILFGTTVPKKSQMRIAMLLWGVFYGIGFGARLGWAFHVCQRRTRGALESITPKPEVLITK